MLRATFSLLNSVDDLRKLHFVNSSVFTQLPSFQNPNSFTMDLQHPACEEIAQMEPWHVAVTWVSLTLSGFAIAAVCYAGEC